MVNMKRLVTLTVIILCTVSVFGYTWFDLRYDGLPLGTEAKLSGAVIWMEPFADGWLVLIDTCEDPVLVAPVGLIMGFRPDWQMGVEVEVIGYFNDVFESRGLPTFMEIEVLDEESD